MEKKEREQLRERMEKHEFLSGGLYRRDIYHDPNQTGNMSGYITTVTENVLDFILEEIEKAREEVLLEIRDELLEQIEKGKKYNIYGGVADYQDALHLVIGMLSKLKE